MHKSHTSYSATFARAPTVPTSAWLTAARCAVPGDPQGRLPPRRGRIGAYSSERQDDASTNDFEPESESVSVVVGRGPSLWEPDLVDLKIPSDMVEWLGEDTATDSSSLARATKWLGEQLSRCPGVADI